MKPNLTLSAKTTFAKWFIASAIWVSYYHFHERERVIKIRPRAPLTCTTLSRKLLILT